MKDFWYQYEKHFREKLPPCVVTLLKECGHNFMSTLRDFDAQNLQECEEYINLILRDLIDSLECCNADTYKNQAVFKFLPAHRNLLLGLPAKIQIMKGVHPNRRVLRPNQNPPVEIRDENQQDENENDISDQLHKDLQQKLSEFGAKHGMESVENMPLANITNVVFRFGENVTGECRIKCPYCENSYKVKYDKNWKLSNIYKHFRDHPRIQIEEEIEVEVDEEIINENAETEHQEVELDTLDNIDENDNQEEEATEYENDENHNANQIVNDSESNQESNDKSTVACKTVSVVIERMNSPEELAGIKKQLRSRKQAPKQ